MRLAFPLHNIEDMKKLLQRNDEWFLENGEYKLSHLVRVNIFKMLRESLLISKIRKEF